RQMQGLLAETSDAQEQQYLQNTLRDLARARGVYSGMLQTHHKHQKQRINYGLQNMATLNQTMVQTSYGISQRLQRALSLTLGSGQSMGVGMPYGSSSPMMSYGGTSSMMMMPGMSPMMSAGMYPMMGMMGGMTPSTMPSAAPSTPPAAAPPPPADTPRSAGPRGVGQYVPGVPPKPATGPHPANACKVGQQLVPITQQGALTLAQLQPSAFSRREAPTVPALSAGAQAWMRYHAAPGTSQLPA
ncbi:MAG: hypothetical protein ACYCW6_15200, partial [Candidatus Xenobia bacterium]